jgi:hypothetical protein
MSGRFRHAGIDIGIVRKGLGKRTTEMIYKFYKYWYMLACNGFIKQYTCFIEKIYAHSHSLYKPSESYMTPSLEAAIASSCIASYQSWWMQQGTLDHTAA